MDSKQVEDLEEEQLPEGLEFLDLTLGTKIANEEEIAAMRSKLKGISLNNMTKTQLCRYMGYANVKVYSEMNPLEHMSMGKISRKKLLSRAKSGHDVTHSLLGISRDLEEQMKLLTPAEREELRREMAKMSEEDELI